MSSLYRSSLVDYCNILKYSSCFAELANHLIEFGSSFSVLGESESDAVGVALSRFGVVSARLAASTTVHVRLRSSSLCCFLRNKHF